MAARLPDEIRVARLRESVRKASARRRVKLSADGKVQTLVWLPGTLRAQLDGMVEARNLSLSAVTAQLLTLALDTATIPTPRPASTSSVDSLPLFDTAPDTLPPLTAMKRDQQILELHRQGVSGREIARQVGCSEPTVRLALKKQTQEATG